MFCHYRETGRALVRHLSVALEKRLWDDAAQRLGLDDRSVRKAVDRRGWIEVHLGPNEVVKFEGDDAEALRNYLERDGHLVDLLPLPQFEIGLLPPGPTASTTPAAL